MVTIKKFNFIFAVVALVFLTSLLSAGTVYAFNGAIYTTDVSCSGVNVNQFASKDDVYLDGGPAGGGSGLPDGEYYVQVTEPDGTLLGTSIGSSDETPAHVTTGKFAQCYKLIDIVIKKSDSSQGFDDTTNGGGVYKVWVSPDSDFDSQKTDNFKVESDVITPPENQGSITLVKNLNILYNGNDGVNDFGLRINGSLVNSGDTVNFPGGTIVSVGEDGHLGYESLGFSGDPDCIDGSVTIIEGENIFCEITNQDIQPSITLTKVVETVYGNEEPDDFDISVDGNIVLSGSTTFVNSNTPIAIDEIQPNLFGYEFVDITGDSNCPSVLGGTVTLDEGKNISCTITNRDTRGKIAVYKFYDTNANGIYDDPGDPLISDWKVNVDNVVEYTFFGGLYLPGDYVVFEYPPIEPNWLATTPTTIDPVTVVTGQTTNVKFGNVCFAPGGGHTIGYWSNKNGQKTMNDGGTMVPELALLTGLNLKNGAGGDFDPSNYSSFRTWILGATATNMSYMLSAQLAAMELNVEAGNVSGSSLVYAPELLSFAPIPGLSNTGFIGISDLMDAANGALGNDGFTPAGDPNRSFQEALKDTLDNANNNHNFLSSIPCSFSFEQ